MTTVTITYDCCGRAYSASTALPEDGLLLANAVLGDTLVMLADAQHEAECTL